MTLRIERAGALARLLIDRPAKRNAFSQSMWEALPGLVAKAVADPAVRVVLLASATPGMFCAGADIAEFAEKASDPAWRTVNNAAIRATQLALSRAEKPVLAVVDGDCIGGGCGLALACDMRIASPRGRFGITPARLGLVYPLHDTKLLVDLVGPAQARRLLFTAALIDSAEALRIGLADIVADDPLAEATALAARIAANAPSTVRAAKAIVRRILDGATDDDPASAGQFDAAFTGPDFAEGVAAFLARRAPVFR